MELADGRFAGTDPRGRRQLIKQPVRYRVNQSHSHRRSSRHDSGSPVKKPRKFRPRSLKIEPLEARELMAVTASLSGAGVLTVTGSNSNDVVNFLQKNSRITIKDVSGSWTATEVKSIVVNLQGGDDVVSLASMANGGSEALSELVTINAGAGLERVRLNDGRDVYFSGVGKSLELAANNTAKLNGVAANVSASVNNLTSGTIATFNATTGALTVVGTSGNDNIRILRNNNLLTVNGVTGSWAAGTVQSIVVSLQGGTDLVTIDSTASGGNQALGIPLTVNSGSGANTVRIASDKQFTFNGLNHILRVATNGTGSYDGQAVTWVAPPNVPAPTPPAPPPPPPPPLPPPPTTITNWFDTNVNDAALRSLGHTLYLDGLVNRNDIISLLRNAGDGGVVDSTELADLRNIVSNTTLFGSLDYVRTLATYVVNSNYANRNYQGNTLGDLTAGSTNVKLDNLVNKWFLGLDRPTTTGTYRFFSGQLFVGGATYSDIHQGAIGDCYFLAALGEVALKSPSTITSMFFVNGDNTYTVKFFNSTGQAFYVTVDNVLPTDGGGNLFYASRGQRFSSTSNELWVALAEKAYAQLNEFGWSRPGQSSGQNSYAALDGGYIYAALGQISGRGTSAFTMTSAPTSFTSFVSAFNAGKMIGFASYANPAPGSGVIGGHAYAVVSYNAYDQTVTLFNPWGTEYGLVTLSWNQIKQNFMYFDRTV